MNAKDPRVRQLLSDLSIEAKDNETLEEIAERRNIDVHSLIALLDQYKGEETMEFQKMTIREQIKELIGYHKKQKELLTESMEYLRRVLFAHFNHHEENLLPLYEAFHAYKANVEIHQVIQERDVFLALKQEIPVDTKRIAQLETLKKEREELAREIEHHTENFTLPKDACPTYELLFEKMKELLDDVRVHDEKEEEI